MPFGRLLTAARDLEDFSIAAKVSADQPQVQVWCAFGFESNIIIGVTGGVCFHMVISKHI